MKVLHAAVNLGAGAARYFSLPLALLSKSLNEDSSWLQKLKLSVSFLEQKMQLLMWVMWA